MIHTSRIFTNDAISIEAILHAGHRGKLCAGPKKEEVVFKDPLNTPPHVHAAFLLGVLSFERIDDRVFTWGLKKGPLVPTKGDVGCKEPEKIKIRERKKKKGYACPYRVEPYCGLSLYYASVLAHGIFST